MLTLIAMTVPATTSATEPYSGSPAEIPGVIEAEHYDKGDAGVAYHDTTPQNEGENYRETTQVDIEKRPDASNGHGIGWTRKGEWLIYTVGVKESGIYTIEFPVASNKQGGTFHIEFGGRDVTGPIAVPDTGGWHKLQTIRKEGVSLSAGVHAMKVQMDTEGASGSIGDIDLFRFIKQ